MSGDLSSLYNEIITDHKKTPRNFKVVENATATIDGYNPLCGDKVKLTLRTEGGTIADIGFIGEGCAISIASASLMTGAVKGKTVAEAEQLFETFHAMIANPTSIVDAKALGKVAALGGARQHASRSKCASLVWHALHAALTQPSAESVSTE
jgi:nitrogen fixation NifU-like protein